MQRLTKREIFEKLKAVPDDTPILFNIQENEDDDFNWDTYNAEIWVDSFMCPGFEGCKHTEPELDCEVVFFIKWMETKK